MKNTLDKILVRGNAKQAFWRDNSDSKLLQENWPKYYCMYIFTSGLECT